MNDPGPRDESYRLAQSIDHQIDTITQRAERQAGVYQRLAKTLPQGIGTQICDWRDEQRALGGADPAGPSRNLAKMLRGLENTLMHLADALSWALSSSGTTWWIEQRSAEIGISEFLVIPRGSYSSDFKIDTSGDLRDAFANFVAIGAVQMNASELEHLYEVRLLNVPLYDGLEAKWYPILTHELAHLKFDETWISEWIAGLETDENTDARTAANHAISRRGDERLAPWFARLLSWLSEVACDTVMSFYYHLEGTNALESVSHISGAQEDTSTHPAPRVRLVIQRSDDPDCLSDYRTNDSTNMDAHTSRNAFCDLALRLRDDVRSYMKIRFPNGLRQAQNAVYRSSKTAIGPDIESALSPSTQSWDQRIVHDQPSVVETGMVRALWAQDLKVLHGNYPAYDDRAELIARSMETLEFIHRFEKSRAELTGDGGQVVDRPVINNLWITGRGIFSHDPAPCGGPAPQYGEAAHDLRLGRYFIAFNRNEVATLSATNMASRSDRVQREVEVAWDDVFVLHPGEMVLGVTLECLILETDCTAQVLSRSSVGRLGLLTATAVHIQPGYRGCPTLELVNLSSVPLSLVPGQRIAQVVPHQICGTSAGYSGYYQNVGWKPQFSKAQNDPDTKILSRMSTHGIGN